MIGNWKRELIEGAAELFDKGQKTKKQHNAEVDERNRQLGQLKLGTDASVVEQDAPRRMLFQRAGKPGGLIGQAPTGPISADLRAPCDGPVELPARSE